MEALKARPAARAREVLGLALVGAFLLVSFGDGLRMPFLNDDYLFLDKVARTPFPAWFGFQDLSFHWWRPWSRELHYGWLSHVFGPNELVFHVANFVLVFAILIAYRALATRLAGARVAGVATCAVAVLAAWGVLLLWVAGVQDLWMLFASALALLAWSHGRRLLATLAFAIALASKETACLLPGVFLAHEIWLARRPLREALLRVSGPALLLLLWAAFHPHLGGRLWGGVVIDRAVDLLAVPPHVALVRSVGSLFNLDRMPAPAASVGRILLVGCAVALLPVAAAWLLMGAGPARVKRARADKGAKPPERSNAGGVRAFALAWTVLGWAPLALPSLGWHAYYALFGAMGAWLALGSWLAARRALALAVIAAIAALALARGATPSLDWGDAYYQRRAGVVLSGMRADLIGRWPTFPPHSRLYFVRVPNNVGFMAGDGPSLRTWYRDTTLRAGFFTAYASRAPGAPRGEDFFFRLDSLTGRWERIVPATQDSMRHGAGPAWQTGHMGLAQVFARAGEWTRAYAELSLLANTYTQDPELAVLAAVARAEMGDSTGAMTWLREAARRPGASREILDEARAAGLLSR